MKILIGSYAKKEQPGICLLNWDGKELSVVASISGIENPSYLEYSEKHNFIYAVSETAADRSEVVTLQYDSFKVLNRTSFEGAASCHLTAYQDKLYLANYKSGSMSVLSLQEGLPTGFSKSYAYKGSGPDLKRQENSHVHCVLVNEKSKELYVADLGTDQMYVYALEDLKELHKVALPPGAGPRQFYLNTQNNILYLLSELSGEIFAFNASEIRKGWISQTALVKSRVGDKMAAAITGSMDGKYLYASTRGDFNEITVFRVIDGHCQNIQVMPCGGIGPRSIALSPDEKWLIVANEKSGNLSVFSVNSETGLLSKIEIELALPGASCVKFIA